MAEKPILFNTEMVRAILDGRKTQTRRLVKGIPLYEPYFEVVDGKPMICDDNGDWHPAEDYSRIQPGDVLWVRETWNGLRTGNPKIGYHTTYWYKADDQDENPDDKWLPSIHMPREAARLFLRVTGVQVERLQDISEDDALAEGANAGEYLDEVGNLVDVYYPHEDFARIWDNTIKKADLRRYGWDANPWVWVIEFERIGGMENE